jgi:diguanylate cyclase
VGWKEIPDIFFVGLLIYAFVAVSRRGDNATSRIWLAAWIMIEIHFFAAVFWNPATLWGKTAIIVAESSLVWAALLFMWAMVPHRRSLSSRAIIAGTGLANTLYIGCQTQDKIPDWALVVAAALIGIIPLAISLITYKANRYPQRWIFTGFYCALSLLLLKIQLPQPSSDWVIVAPLTVAYAGCCVHFWLRYRSSSAGAIVTLCGFLAWTSVFPIGTLGPTLVQGFHVDAEVWNLPKYLVAVGMILLLLEDQLNQNRHMALHDELTGLSNRRLFLDCLAGALERARRGNTQMAILAVDLNGFKEVNDTMGHHVGDLVLQQVAGLFSTRVRKADTLARTGGDEFSVILEAPAGREEAQFLGGALNHLLQTPIQVGEHMLNISASIGIAVYPDDAQEIQSLCVVADQRMYNSKRTTKIEVEPKPESRNPRLNPSVSKIHTRIPDPK